MKLVTPGQMNRIDSLTINKIGIPGIVLMENAALKVVDEAIKLLGSIQGRKVVVFAGKGNNGGDAFAVSRHLYNKGAMVEIFIAADKNTISGDARINLDILYGMDIFVRELLAEDELDEARKAVFSAELIIDGLLGTGIKGEVGGIIKDIIDIINEAGKSIISVDIPSGIDGGSGRICGSAIKAFKTVTFGLPKIGQVIHPGCEYTGDLIVSDIGIPGKVIEELDIKANLIDENMVSGMIPSRSSDSNKGDYGKVLVVSGSVGMTGAGCLTAGAALRTGAGLVYLPVPAMLSSVYDAALLEAVTIPLEDDGKGSLGISSIDGILERLKRVTVSAVGPGLSASEEIIDVVGAIIENSTIPLILDADALNAVSKDISLLKKKKADIVITPHPGEMSRLTGISIHEVQNNRIETAVDFAVKWGVTTVLKGARTVVACPDGSVYINKTGNSGMATGGTGDVLTGIIAGLIGQGVNPNEAAIAGVYIHGAAGDSAAETKGEHGMIAGDVVSEIPFTIKKLLGKLEMKN